MGKEFKDFFFYLEVYLEFNLTGSFYKHTYRNTHLVTLTQGPSTVKAVSHITVSFLHNQIYPCPRTEQIPDTIPSVPDSALTYAV